MSSHPQPAGIHKLEPAVVWKFFADIAAVPRPSKKEERIREHILHVAEKLGLETGADAHGNVRLTVPATRGCEDAPLTVLQAHLDMVCEKNAGTTHDFDQDPIRLVIDADPEGKPIVRADGTTLGADNGIGVALALAAATEPDVRHGPLELLLTLDEEDGMTGAGALTEDSFRGRRLVNLDSEEDDALYIGCAGGCDTNLVWTGDTRVPPKDWETCELTVRGLRGGHSGGDIHEGRGNANKLLVRTLLRMGCQDLCVAAMRGGSKRNAIPREAAATVCAPAGLGIALREAARQVTAEAAAESREPGAAIELSATPTDTLGAAMTPNDSSRLLAALAALPNGVLGMHPDVPGLVETSTNLSTLGSAPTGGGKKLQVTAGLLSRSSSESRIDDVLSQIAAIGELSGAHVDLANRYPGWEPNVNSPLLATCRSVYESLFGQAPHVAAIHAGLECGIIGRRVGQIDMVSFGPRIEGAHSPDERVWVESVQKTWTYLKAVLAELSKG